jgi:hypothetical protein
MRISEFGKSSAPAVAPRTVPLISAEGATTMTVSPASVNFLKIGVYKAGGGAAVFGSSADVLKRCKKDSKFIS